ncbi:MAG: hypothetical protein M1444_03495 [Patescibacteria group bacterium]|nr:hypothetical protein [Patescibacteria group bacterium]
MEQNQSSSYYWPRISFEELENLEVEGIIPNMMYKSLIFFIRIPEKTASSFITLLKSIPE